MKSLDMVYGTDPYDSGFVIFLKEYLTSKIVFEKNTAFSFNIHFLSRCSCCKLIMDFLIQVKSNWLGIKCIEAPLSSNQMV